MGSAKLYLDHLSQPDLSGQQDYYVTTWGHRDIRGLDNRQFKASHSALTLSLKWLEVMKSKSKVVSG